uniref:CAZy families CE12 protein n=1 Tax=uncultured Flavobacterium sp. TaxID=165435 RepID=A0A060CP69_9FLAO|nr:CAZy families CE12 protein [uncultured Flavobacterium sp.]
MAALWMIPPVARGYYKGIGNESKEIYNPIERRKKQCILYGHYMRQFVNDAKAKGAIPVICSPIPRNIFSDGKVRRSNHDYGLWAQQVAEQPMPFLLN